MMNFLLIACLSFMPVCSAMNLTKPYDYFMKPIPHETTQWLFSAYVERGIGHARGFNCDGCSVNVLRIWNNDQNALAMLKGFDESSAIGQLLDQIQGIDTSPIDDGIRGHFCVNGNLKLNWDAGFGLRYFLPLDFSAALYLPVYSFELTDVCWQDLTNPELPTDADVRVKEHLTNNFFGNVCRLGNLNLGPWKRTGFGDLAFIVEWLRDFPQRKPLLKNVQLNARLGFIFPTGKRADEDKIFARQFGTDGALGLLFGGNLTVTWGTYFRAGLDIQLLHRFGNTRERRIKTDADQTELLLLAKACAYKDWGMQQEFNIFVQLYNCYGYFAMADYQFVKQGEDRLSLYSVLLSNETANNARFLDDWTSHSAVFKVGYDLSFNYPGSRVLPTVALYAKVPFNGRNSALFTSVGLLVGLDF